MVISKNLKVIIFDFDGTLHNLNIDWDDVRRILEIYDTDEKVGDAIDRLRASGKNHKSLLELTELEVRALSSDNLDEDIKNTLLELQKTYKIVILSRNSSKAIEYFLSKNDIYPDFIVGREEVMKLKPDPEGLYKIIDYFNCKSDETILVGDTWHDLELARKVGIRCYIVGNNFRHSLDLPDYRISKISDLTEILKQK